MGMNQSPDHNMGCEEDYKQFNRDLNLNYMDKPRFTTMNEMKEHQRRTLINQNDQNFS